jgi:hypothetical protein
MMTTMGHQRTARRGRQATIAFTVSSAAVPGEIFHQTFARPTATGLEAWQETTELVNKLKNYFEVGT